ncbi:hypothetical protein BU14_0058s0025 [Porphyra umbilicalis]|uniref:Uncharacterized protein n=1 Tax=Porphyra umbilicalis TaxID=2786 RepID=A0A1X6PGX0_PORUM|nr:hypothetical protein BU14_0058s0025 [Porphyra umbilicalis]|eukprot:OSX80114.1 hypothetical protein BU14_0058s0025 [Porphyra umbilicalis]
MEWRHAPAPRLARDDEARRLAAFGRAAVRARRVPPARRGAARCGAAAAALHAADDRGVGAVGLITDGGGGRAHSSDGRGKRQRGRRRRPTDRPGGGGDRRTSAPAGRRGWHPCQTDTGGGALGGGWHGARRFAVRTRSDPETGGGGGNAAARAGDRVHCGGNGEGVLAGVQAAARHLGEGSSTPPDHAPPCTGSKRTLYPPLPQRRAGAPAFAVDAVRCAAPRGSL